MKPPRKFKLPVNPCAFNSAVAVLALLFGSLAPICNAAQQDLQPGIILPKITTLQYPEQSYALYLPSNYTSNNRWPIIYVFDPAARGRVPVDLMKEAAERYGYIVAGSNNSRNGSWKTEAEAAQAMLQDTSARLSVDDRRIYFAGFSGGARLSAGLAQRCGCAAGVILSGAGFQPGTGKTPVTFAVFAAVGSYDFNYGEIVALDETLQKLNAPHFLRRFDGPHQWPSAIVFDEALAWLRLQAMKSGREPRDDSFITAHVLRETGRAHSLESADPFAAWFEYRQAAETFDGLTDVSQLQSQRKALEKQKSVVDGGKREKQEIKEQVLLSAGIFRGFASLSGDGSNNDSPPANALNNVREQIHTLKSWAEHEKRQERARVMKRALGAILVNAMEAGLARLDANDPGHARDYFELAKAADPDSVWVLTNLAVARAANGDRRDALETLRRTKEKWTDREAFTAWLNSQAAFAKLRDTPEFLSLLQ